MENKDQAPVVDKEKIKDDKGAETKNTKENTEKDGHGEGSCCGGCGG